MRPLLVLLLLMVLEGTYGQTVITAGSDTTICIGGSAHLAGTVISGSYGTTSYTFETFDYTPEPFTGGTDVMFEQNQDDKIAGPFNIGFDFCFFNQTYSQFYIGSNGWVGFSYDISWTSFTAQPIPSTQAAVPKNCIMAPWQDWWPGWTPEGTTGRNVFYYLTGTAPNRKLVVYWLMCPLYNCTDSLTKRGTFQIVLNEQNSIVENHIDYKPNCSQTENATQGVHNLDGTIAFTADGRNCTPWTTTDESTRFVPSGIRWFTGGYPGGTVVGYGPDLEVSPTVTTTYTVAVESCGGGTATDDVTVFVVDPGFSYSPSAFCSTDPDPTPATLQLTGVYTATPPGLVFLDDTTGVIDISASTPGTYSVTHTISTPCTCVSSQNITIHPSPLNPQATADSVFRCGPGSVTFSVIPIVGEDYSWYDAPTGGTKLGMGTTLTLNLAGTTTVWVESQTISTACISSIRTPVTAVIRPVPQVTNSIVAFTQCDNLPFSVTFTSDVPGTLFTWSCTPSSAFITGWADNIIPAAFLNQTLDNTGFGTEGVTYHVVPVKDGCPGPATDFTVTVNPTPDLSNIPLSAQICNNTSPNITLTSNTAGTLFTWTCTPSSANITGWSDNAIPTTLLDQVLVNLAANVEAVTYHIFPSANGCPGAVTDYTVSVAQSPDVSFNPASQTICSEQASNIQLLSSSAGTTFSWTVTASSPSLSGQSAGSGSIIAQNITNSGITIETLTYTVTPTTAGCPPGTPADVILTVNPKPQVSNIDTTSQICSASATNIIPASTLPGSTFSWTATGSSPNITGFSGGSGNMIVQTLTNSGFGIEMATYAVTPSANGCSGDPVSFVVTVFPVANAVFNPAGQSICSGGVTAISISSGVAGASFSWTASAGSPSVTGYGPGSGNLIQQTLTNTDPGPQTTTYVVSPAFSGCPGTPATVVVTVNPNPVVTFVECFDNTVTTSTPPFDLKGATPPGGIYSGPGVSAGQFLPGFAGPGTHVIQYLYTNTWGCTATATRDITVVAPVPFTCGSILTDARDSQQYPTVQIGTQCWMAANLSFGNVIPASQAQRDNCIVEKYCFGDNPSNCTSVGALYQWDELMRYSAAGNARGVCPPEWHIPSEGEWNTLFTFYTSNGFAGSPLKYTGFSGFNALLSGVRFHHVRWDFNGFATLLWSSTPHGPWKAWAHGMNEYNPSVSFYPSLRSNAFSVRCIRD